MNQTQKKQVVATLLKAGRRDLARQFVGAAKGKNLSDTLAVNSHDEDQGNHIFKFTELVGNSYKMFTVIISPSGLLSTKNTKGTPTHQAVHVATNYARKEARGSVTARKKRVKVTAAKKHKDVEYEVGRKIFKTLDEAAAHAVLQGMSGSSGTVNIDVLVHSEAGAKALMGDAGVESYQEDPDASVFMRIEVEVNMVGRVA